MGEIYFSCYVCGKEVINPNDNCYNGAFYCEEHMKGKPKQDYLEYLICEWEDMMHEKGCRTWA